MNWQITKVSNWFFKSMFIQGDSEISAETNPITMKMLLYLHKIGIDLIFFCWFSYWPNRKDSEVELKHGKRRRNNNEKRNITLTKRNRFSLPKSKKWRSRSAMLTHLFSLSYGNLGGHDNVALEGWISKTKISITKRFKQWRCFFTFINLLTY